MMHDCDCNYKYEYNTSGKYRDQKGGFFGGYFSRIINEIMFPIERAIDRKKMYFRRQILSMVMGIVGWIFLLYGLVIIINYIMGIGRWPGFVAVGLILILISVAKNKNNQYG